MSRTTYRCDGCHAELTNQKDLERDPGTVRRSWRCAYCGTTVPGIVAEKLNHQRQNG